MAGLLYKDFVAVKGKLYIVCILAGMLLLFCVRVALHIEGMDLIMFALYMFIAIALFGLLVNQLEIRVISVDEGRKQKNYFLGLPLSRQQYVASKYIFLLIGFFTVLSVLVLTGYICLIGCRDKAMNESIGQLMSLMPVLACVLLFVPSIELPFFIGFGSKKGYQIKNGLLIICFFLGIIYLLFGNLAVLENISLIDFLNYMEKHPGITLSLQVSMPYCSLGMYYLSYRISCLLFLRKEWEND